MRTRILLVDDDRAVLQLYRTMLGLAGFVVETAADGLGALQKVDEDPPSLVVLDLHMPGLDGVTVLSELRANRATWSIPVVVVTGADYQHVLPQASAVLTKPCEPEQLIATIEQHISAA